MQRSAGTRIGGLLAIVLLTLLFMFLVWAEVGQAEPFAVTGFDGAVLTQDGAAASQAGSHPYEATTQIDFASVTDPTFGFVLPTEDPRDIKVELPPGLVGNPTAVAQCTEPQLTADRGGYFGGGCPAESVVGIAHFQTAVLAVASSPISLMVPAPGATATFGFRVGNVKIHLDAVVRSEGDYGLNVDVLNISQAAPLTMSGVTFWGLPTDPSHDAERAEYGIAPSTMPPVPFLTNPTACTPAGEGLETRLFARSWQGGSDSASFISHDVAPNETLPLGPTGCDQVPFDPSVSMKVDATSPDAPTGLSVDLAFPTAGILGPNALATANLKDAQVTLPEGMTINPAGAGGLQACSDAELKLKSRDPVTCPDASRIGTATATTPLLDEQLSGGVYLRSQNSSDPESGEMFRIALVLENKLRGLSIRLPGSIRADKDTGRLVTTFANNPQLPVETISLRFKGGPRAPLATPSACGTQTIDVGLTAWSGKSVTQHPTFDLACNADTGGFSPSFAAGVSNPVGGAFSPFTVGIAKPDGDVAVDGLTMVLPTGLLAKLKDNLGTQVGTVTAFAGPGSNPFMLPGQVFLEGVYGDAPFSLRVVVPAKAGPFDLGEVVVRQKIYVDPITAQVTVVSDPIPTIVKGVPVRLQRLDVDVDKPGFVINPTSCAAKAIDGALHAVTGTTAALSVRFQVGSCSDLALKRALALSLSGKGQTVDGKHPAVTADLTQPFGAQANLKKVRVALPLSLALDPDNANGLCEFVDGSKVTPTCPKASIVGSATAITPILDEPLSGPVYFVKNIRKDAKSGREIRTLPKLVIPLVGQNGVKLTLTGTSDVVDDQLVTTFDNIPDAPVSSFKLSIIGGKGGILTVSGADICKATQIADQQVDGQNSKAADADVYIQTPSCPLKVISKKVGRSSVAVKVGGLGAGKVTVTGRGIRKTTKTVAKSTVATITARRTTGKPGRVAVSFLAEGVKKAKRTSR